MEAAVLPGVAVIDSDEKSKPTPLKRVLPRIPSPGACVFSENVAEPPARSTRSSPGMTMVRTS